MRIRGKYINISIIILTFVGIILRFLLNEKGRVTPDSIRYMRQAKIFPIIDNTTAPLGYPLAIKSLTVFALDEFWSSKVVGLLTYFCVLIICYRKRFYFNEIVITSALFSFVSIFSFTMSEALILPFVILLFYLGQQAITGKISHRKAAILMGGCLILSLNIRYSALFVCSGCVIFGLINFKERYAKSFISAGLAGIGFYGFYKIFFIDYFNDKYIDTFLEIGLKPTRQLLMELVQGLGTGFNPFIHIASPGGGVLNLAIYSIGILTVLVMIVTFVKIKLPKTEIFILTCSVTGIACSYFVQYFYSVNALDYRLLAPFSVGIWLIFIRRLFLIFGKFTYAIALLSLCTGFAFTWLSRGDYLENRKIITAFLQKEKLQQKTLKFYMKDEGEPEMQLAELISTVNPKIYITLKPKDTLDKTVLTRHRVEPKKSIKKNKYQ